MSITDYMQVDIDNFETNTTCMTRNRCTVIPIKNGNYHSALSFNIEKFGESGEHSWWVASYLDKNVETRTYFQEYEFVFKDHNQALQFKLMGF